MRHALQQPAEFQARILSDNDADLFALAAGAGASVFQSSRFVSAIAAHVASADAQLVFVGVTDASGVPVALFTFVARRRFGLAMLEALDFGLSDYFAPILLRPTPLNATQSDALWQAVLKVVPGAHAVAFKKLPRQLYGESHALSGAAFLKPMGASATTLRLTPTNQGNRFPVDRMSVARDVRRKTRKLEQLGKLQLTQATTQDEVDSFLQTLVAMRRARFAELGRSDALLDDSIVAFYRDLASPGERTPVGRIFALHAGTTIVAVVYGFCVDGVFTLIAIAIATDKDLQAGSPGLVALYNTLEWCVRHDYRVFDLSVGSMHYKARFDAEQVELFEYQQALSPLGLIIVAEAALRRTVRHLALKAPQFRHQVEQLTAWYSKLKTSLGVLAGPLATLAPLGASI